MKSKNAVTCGSEVLVNLILEQQISPDSNNPLNHPLKPLRKAKTCSRQMDAIIQGALLLRTVPVMADAVATFSCFR